MSFLKKLGPSIQKVSYIYEIPLFYGFLLFLNQVVASSLPGFLGVDPHPFWLGVLVFGIRYGVSAGLISGIVSTSLYLGIAKTTLEPYLFEDVRFYVLPSCFILFGVLFGVVSGTYRNRFSRSKEENEVLKVNLKVREEEIETLKEINLGLEKKIVSRMATLVTLYEGVRRLEVDDPEVFWSVILDFITKTLSADKASLYLRIGDFWSVKQSFGWEAFEKHPQKLGYQEGLVGMAGASGKIVSVRDFIDVKSQQGPELLGDAVMAGPIRRGEDGEVVAVIGIQRIPFLLFNSATLNLFSFLLQWASRSLGKLHQFLESSELDILDAQYRVYSKRYFHMRGEQEYQRSKLYYLPLSVGVVHIRGLSHYDSQRQKRVMTVMAEILKRQIRPMDVLARFREEQDSPFAFLLMTSNQAQALEMRDKMMASILRIESDLSVSIRLSHFNPSTNGWEALLAEAMNEVAYESPEVG